MDDVAELIQALAGELTDKFSAFMVSEGVLDRINELDIDHETARQLVRDFAATFWEGKRYGQEVMSAQTPDSEEVKPDWRDQQWKLPPALRVKTEGNH
jgi:hypothetical protein